MQNITVSIIVPIYNVEPYIERCLMSVMRQTFTDIECILVDDCGKDDSVAITEKTIQQYQGQITFKIIHHEHNRGLSAARNSGIDAASGEYIYFLDSDDELLPNSIELLTNEFIKHPEVEIVCGNCLEPYENRRVYHIDKYKYLNDNTRIRYYLFCGEQAMPIIACNKLIRRDFLIRNNLYFREGLIHEDVLWIYKVVLKLNHYILLPDETYIYHLNEDSIVSKTGKITKSRSMAKILNEIGSSLEEPLLLLSSYKYLLRLFLYYKDLPAKEYQSVANTFCKSFWDAKEYKTAIIIWFYFKFYRSLHLNCLESKIMHWIGNCYSRHSHLASIKYNLHLE